MARLTSAELLKYTQIYIHDVFADTLKQEGFVSPDGKNTIWYRVVNHELVNTICFFSLWPSAPIILKVGYGIHPLFVEPFRTSTVYINKFPYNRDVLRDIMIESKDGPGGGRYYASNVPVMIPHGPDKGLYTLEEHVLPQMNAAKTPRDCYELHKARYLETYGPDLATKTHVFSDDFINEGIFFEDTDFYPVFRERIATMSQQYENYDEKFRNSKRVREWMDHLEYQRKALLEDDREAFLESMAQRRKKTVDLLQKKFKIEI